MAACLIITFQSQAVLATCGDGVRQATEQCDEGAANGAPGSGCSFACTIEDGCYCDAPIGQESTCTCNNNSDYLYLLLIPLALLCCLLPLALLALGGNGGGYGGGYGGYGGGYGGYGGGYGGWRGLSSLFGKAAPAPVVEAPPHDAFVPAVIMPNTAPELPIREFDSRSQVVLSYV